MARFWFLNHSAIGWRGGWGPACHWPDPRV